MLDRFPKTIQCSGIMGFLVWLRLKTYFYKITASV